VHPIKRKFTKLGLTSATPCFCTLPISADNDAVIVSISFESGAEDVGDSGGGGGKMKSAATS
jgi:hypothetical protein